MKPRWLAVAFGVAIVLAAIAQRVSAGQVAATPLDSVNPVVALSGSRIHIAWIELTSTTDGLRATVVATTSDDGGETFAPPTTVANLSGSATALRMSVSGESVHLVWLATAFTTGSPSAVDYARSTDGGATFEDVLAVNGATTPGIPEVHANGGCVVVGWAASGRIRLAESWNAGSTFSDPIVVSDGDLVADGSLRLGMSSSHAVGVWLALIDGSQVLRVGRVSLEPDPQMSEPRTISAATARATEPTLDVRDGCVAIGWVETSTNRRLYAVHSTDGGLSFSSAVTVGKVDTLANPRIAALATGPHVVWAAGKGKIRYWRIGVDQKTRVLAKRISTPAFLSFALRGAITVVGIQSGAGDLVRSYALVSSDGGASFGKPIDLGSGRRGAAFPSVATDGTQSAVVWQMPSARDDQVNDIFFLSPE